MTFVSQNETSTSPELLIVGEVNVDLILEHINELPALETERRAEGMAMTLGGSSAILAANAAALEVQVGFVGSAGDDEFGGFLLDILSRRGVDVSHIHTSKSTPTGVTIIYTYEGQRGMITYPGTMEEFSIDDIPWHYVKQAQHLHLSSFYLQKGLRDDCRALFERARELGLSTSLDTNWDPDEEWGHDVLDVLEEVDVFLPNDKEARLISEKDDLNEAMDMLVRRGCIVVATCGADGVRARAGEDVIEIPGLQVNPVDAVGAGDSFNAGFLQQYIKGEPLERCLEQGLLTGAYSTQRAGGIQAFDDLSEFNSFSQKHRNRRALGASITK